MRGVRGAKAALACALVAAGAAAGAQPLGQSGDDVSLWRIAGAFVLCIAIAIAAALLLRARYGVGGPVMLRRNTRLQLIENVRLNPQVQLCIVRCDGEEMLLSTCPTGAALVKPIGAARAEPDA